MLADDHPLFLRALEAGLEEEGVTVVGLACSGEEVVSVVAAVEPDVILLDLEMPGAEGVSCVRELRAWHPETKIVMLSGHDDPTSVANCVEAGAVCFVGKQTSVVDIADLLRALLTPEVRFADHPPTATTRSAPATELTDVDCPLTQRELEILRIVSTGSSNAEVARQLWVTQQTVKFHLGNIFRKLEVTNRTEAARRGVDLGLVDHGIPAEAVR